MYYIEEFVNKSLYGSRVIVWNRRFRTQPFRVDVGPSQIPPTLPLKINIKS